MERVTIKDIAAKAGVSVSLVSCVMNNYALDNGKNRYRVSEKTQQKILDVAKELNYEPNMAARMLRGAKSRIIGAILADISNEFYGSMAKYFEQEFYSSGYTLLIANSDEKADKFEAAVNSLLSRDVDGIIVVPCEGSLPSLMKLEKNKIPYVVWDRSYSQLHAPVISIDGVDAMRNAVKILHEKGIDDICMLSLSMRVSSVLERERGFVDEAYGEEISILDCDRILKIDFANQSEEIDRFVSEGMYGAKGIVTATNELAVTLIKSMMKHGKKVQQDVFIVGFDEDNAYTFFEPAIPHIVQPVKEMCRLSSKELLDIIEKRSIQEYKKIVVKCSVQQ